MAAVSAAAQPRPEPESGDDALEREFREAQDGLEEAIARAGMTQDPYVHVLHWQKRDTALRFRLTRLVLDKQEAARQPLDPAAIRRIEAAAAQGASSKAREIAVGYRRLTLVAAAGIVLGGLGITGVGGYGWGHATAMAQRRATEARLSAAFSEGGKGAALWLALMQYNDLGAALANCTPARVYTDREGRRACAVPLYIEAAKAAPGR